MSPPVLLFQSILPARSRPLLPFQSAQSVPRASLTTTRRLLDQNTDNNPKISTNYAKPPAPKPRGQSSPLRVWPFVLIFATGTVLFLQIVKQRQGLAPAPTNAPSQLSGFGPPSGPSSPSQSRSS
ncbi:hypothetical protein LTS18_000806 [Coniosporium uncinatum]|uniref:Uncharacterized protein n=1 Tax=Coniosporium uncinatum TaxID=93489 RepID=A0ACC3CTP1_9PEZI|nr:hypothetical protein LTS18_000806 [Coniosporium uncinatum]